MNKEKPNVGEYKSITHFAGRTKRLLLFYDIIIFALVELLLLVIYKSDNIITWKTMALQSALAFICIFCSRFAWKIYGQVWRYGGIQSYIRLLASDACSFFAYFFAERIFLTEHISFARILSISCMSLLGSLAMRMIYRYAYKCYSQDTAVGKVLNALLKFFAGNRVELEKGINTNKINIAIIGAGRVGVSFAQELKNNKSSAYTPRCFTDTSSEKVGRQICGLPILSELKMSTEQLSKYDIQEIVVALPQLASDEKLAIYSHYNKMGYKVKVYDYPELTKIENGKRQLREFSVEELLFRKPIVVTNSATNMYYKNKVILITGGGGSIGSELCRQVAKMQPKRLIILDIYENGAYDLQQDLKMAYGNSLDVCVEIVSVCNRKALERVFEEYRPNIVLNAAAHKHVPLMEHNCCEAVENNVFGTLNTVELSEKYGVERLIMVSTDKAVHPTNVMGATKRMCELIVQCHSRIGTGTTFSITRFGNVLGSAGSVIPLFKKQIANGGPITITDKRIIRYFMTIPEASQVVLQSGAMAKNGELFVLDMGNPIKILDLAESMIRLSGFEPYKDIDIQEIGLRPGEKLYEELLINREKLDKTENDLIFIEHDTEICMEELNSKLQILATAIEDGDNDVVKAALHKAIKTYCSPDVINERAQLSEEMLLAISK